MIPRDEPVQDVATPEGVCFGCGPANPDGLGLESYLSDDGESLVATFEPDPKFTGPPDAMYGGLVASLIDCHSGWAAVVAAHRDEERPLSRESRIEYATANLTVDYLDPTPLDRTIHLEAWVEGDPGRKANVVCELGPDGAVTATGDSLFVRVSE